MTKATAGSKGEGTCFANTDEVRIAFDAGEVDLQAEITLRIDGKMAQTTVGRVLLWEIVPKEMIVRFKHIKFSAKKKA